MNLLEQEEEELEDSIEVVGISIPLSCPNARREINGSERLIIVLFIPKTFKILYVTSSS